LILDLSLPDMPGIGVIQQIREGDRVDGRIAPRRSPGAGSREAGAGVPTGSAS
jgi:hypothetical protein